ncbi:MAG: Fic family protein [Candidatus Saccharibacteria bacterium]
MTDYFVDGDDVLENRFGIINHNDLKEIEQEIVTKKTAIVLGEAFTVFDFNLLLHIHKVLFEDIYDFAGKIRTVNIAKPGAAPFAYAKFISNEAVRIFDELASKKYLSGLGRQSFVQEISNLSAELNALHPFREGNGRTIRLFLILVADSAGYLIDYSQVSSKDLIRADKLAFEGDTKSLVTLYEKAVFRAL